jgi:hypothetical protein
VPEELIARAQLIDASEAIEKEMKKGGMGVIGAAVNRVVKMGEKAAKSGGLKGMMGGGSKDEPNEEREHRKRKKPVSATLEKAPFGELRFENYFWEGKVVLKAWGGFDASRGTFEVRNPGRSRRVSLNIVPPGEDDENPAEPAKEQGAALEYLKENEEAIRGAVLAAIFKAYFKGPARFLVFLGDDQMPQKVEELEDLVSLAAVHILNVAKDGKAYVGFEFDCAWDEEHGVGVLTHGQRVVAAEIAHTAYDEYAAENDGGRRI